MKPIRMTQVPWRIMISVNECQYCDRINNCTHKDLLLCFMSNADHVVEMTKEEAENLEHN